MAKQAKTKVKTERKFAYLTTNITPTAVRNDTMEDRDYLVAPVVMMVEGVHVGDLGPILYTAEELGKLPVAWNTKPVVVYHPVRNGMQTTACIPIEISSRKIGVIMNSTYDKGLKAETWMEPDRIEKVDARVGEALVKNEMMEVSIGVWMDLEIIDGTWNGPNGPEEYTMIAHNLVPDHLAILPDLVGACSIEDGAGLLRTNKSGSLELVVSGRDVLSDSIRIEHQDKGQFKPDSLLPLRISNARGIRAIVGELKDSEQAKGVAVHEYVFDKGLWTKEQANKWITLNAGCGSISELIMNEMSHDMLRRLLHGELREKRGDDAWVEEVYDAFIIFEEGGQLYSQAYENTEGGVSLTGEATEVIRVVEYRTPQGTYVGSNTPSIQNERKKEMDRKKIVDTLIANEKLLWCEDDRDFLMKMPEEKLSAWNALAKDPEQTDNGSTDNGQEGGQTTTTPDVVSQVANQAAQITSQNPAQGFKTTAEYIQTLPSDVRAMVQNGLAEAQRIKTGLIAAIVANARNTFTKEFLETKDIVELRGIAVLCQGDEESAETNPLYIGQQGTVPASNVADEEPLEVPSLELATP